MAPLLINLPQLVDMALATPEMGVVNVTVLHSLLHVLIRQANLQAYRVEFHGSDHSAMEELVAIIPATSPVTIDEFRVTNPESPEQRQAVNAPSSAELGTILAINVHATTCASNAQPPGFPLVPMKILSASDIQVLENRVSSIHDRLNAVLPSGNELRADPTYADCETGPLNRMVYMLNTSKRVDAVEIGLRHLAQMVASLAAIVDASDSDDDDDDGESGDMEDESQTDGSESFENEVQYQQNGPDEYYPAQPGGGIDGDGGGAAVVADGSKDKKQNHPKPKPSADGGLDGDGSGAADASKPDGKDKKPKTPKHSKPGIEEDRKPSIDGTSKPSKGGKPNGQPSSSNKKPSKGAKAPKNDAIEDLELDDVMQIISDQVAHLNCIEKVVEENAAQITRLLASFEDLNASLHSTEDTLQSLSSKFDEFSESSSERDAKISSQLSSLTNDLSVLIERLNNAEITFTSLIEAAETEFRRGLLLQQDTFIKTMMEVQCMMDGKVDKLSIPALKEFLIERLNAFHDTLEFFRHEFGMVPDASATTVKLIRNVDCLSCKQPVTQKNREVPPFVQRMQSAVPGNVIRGKLRYTGGSHTSTLPEERVPRHGYFPTEYGDVGANATGELSSGNNGQLYRTRTAGCDCGPKLVASAPAVAGKGNN